MKLKPGLGVSYTIRPENEWVCSKASDPHCALKLSEFVVRPTCLSLKVPIHLDKSRQSDCDSVTYKRL